MFSVRRMLVIVLAAAYAIQAAGVGLRIPGRHLSRASNARFPCEHSTCGCADAEQCWRSCCCSTLTQRLAWAEREGVTPPAFVGRLISVERQRLSATSVSKPSVLVEQCTHCKPADVLIEKPCDGRVETCGESSCDISAELKGLHGSGGTSLVRTLDCQGQAAMAWASVPPTPPMHTLAHSAPRIVTQLWCVPSVNYSTVTASPPTPPPEPRFLGVF